MGRILRKAVITGAADTPVGRLPEHNCMSLQFEARGPEYKLPQAVLEADA